jgi:small subunit ribosomal protein S17
LQQHRLYGKVIKRASKFKAHNEGNQARAGDLVRIVESRPMSRDKRWVVEAVVEKAQG